MRCRIITTPGRWVDIRDFRSEELEQILVRYAAEAVAVGVECGRTHK
jgi:hypothetical protein